MAKQLKIWNGRGHGKYDKGHFYVAAYTQKQAAELLCKADGYGTADFLVNRMLRELREFYSAGCWGNPMNGIEPVEPCVYATKRSWTSEKPKRIV